MTTHEGSNNTLNPLPTSHPSQLLAPFPLPLNQAAHVCPALPHLRARC